jgi:O-antigen/teichoic acid export membrane protein
MGNIVYGASQWAMLIFLAKLGSPAMVGSFTLALAICAPVVIFTNLQLRNILSTDVEQQFRFRSYVELRLFCSCIAMLIIVTLTIVMQYPPDRAVIILLIGMAKVIESISDILYGRLQRMERLDIVAKSTILKGLGSVAVTVCCLYLTHNLLWTIAAYTMVWLLLLLFYDLPKARQVGDETGKNIREGRIIEAAAIKRMLVMALPLGAAGFLDTFNANLPRYFVEQHVGVTELGYFSAIVYIMIAGAMVVSAIGQSVTPRLAKYFSRDRHAFGVLFRKVMLLGAGISLVSVLIPLFFGSELLAVIYTPEYSGYNRVFQWSMLGGALWYVASFLECGIYAIRNFKVQTPILICVVASTCISLYLLLPRYALVGAAVSICIGMLVRLLGGIIIFTYLYMLSGRRREARESYSCQ